MATIDNNFRTGYRLRINWWVNSQDVASNCTNITAQVQLISTGSSYTIRASATKYGVLDIDGTEYSFSFNASLGGNETKTIFEKNVNIYHWGDGTRYFGIRAKAGIKVTLSGTFWDTVNVASDYSYTNCTLDTIPRRSTITGISGDWFGSDMTVTIDQKSSSFTTSVFVKTPNSDWVNVIWKQSGTSFTFTLPLSLVNSLPQACGCTGTVKIRTYNGDTEIGDDDWGKSMSVPESIVPSIDNTGVGSDTTVNGTPLFVQNKSRLNVQVAASGAYSSWITDVRVDYDGASYWGGNIWTNVQRIDGTRPVTITVWDSRGRTATYTRNDIYVQWYQNPWGNLQAYRCDANGNRDDTSGTRIKVIYSGDKAWLAGHNTFSLKIDHREQGGDWEAHNDIDTSSTTTETSFIFNYNSEQFSLEKAYEIRLRVSDWYTTTTYVVPISTAFVLMDFKAGGKGLGIGRVCTSDHQVQINMGLHLYAGRENNPDLGADLVFDNVSKSSDSIGICGGTPNSELLLQLYKFTDSNERASGPLIHIDRHGNYADYFNQHIIYSNIFFAGDLERQIRYNNSTSYMYWGANNGNIGAWDDSVGLLWNYDKTSQTVNLKAGYQAISDRRKKYDFDEFTNWDDFYNFYMSLKPQTFKYNEDMSERTYIGMVAQDVMESVVDNNLSNERLALVRERPNDDYEDGREYSLAYQELISLNVKMIQKHEEEIKELNNTIAKQQEEIDQLKDMVNQLVNQGGK